MSDANGGIYMGDSDEEDDDDSLESPFAFAASGDEQFTSASTSSPSPSQQQQQMQNSNSSSLNNSNSLLHSTIEEDREYVSDLDHQQQLGRNTGSPTAAPLSPKGWHGGSPFIMVPPSAKNSSGSGGISSKSSSAMSSGPLVGRGGPKEQQTQPQSQSNKDPPDDSNSSNSGQGDSHNDSSGRNLLLGREFLVERSSSESTNSSQGKVNFSGLTKAIKADATNSKSSRRNLSSTNSNKSNSPGRGGRRTVLTSQGMSVSSSSMDTIGALPPPQQHQTTAKQHAVQQALLKQGKNPLTMANTLQATSARSLAFSGGFSTGPSIGDHSESNYSDSEKVYEVNMNSPNPPRSGPFSSLIGRSPAANRNKTKASFFSSKLHRRPRLTGVVGSMMSNHHHHGDDTLSGRGGREGAARSGETLPSTAAASRRYKVGDHVLVRNAQSKWANLVNRYGFPPGQGETPEERRGPYMYVLATVRQMHFEEIHPYYTVTRCDTGGDQRADAHFMEPLRTHRGEMAALRAATETSGVGGRPPGMDGGAQYQYDYGSGGAGDEGYRGAGHRSLMQAPTGGKIAECLQSCCFYMLLPFLWIFDCMQYVWVTFLSGFFNKCSDVCRRQARLFLYGDDLYVCAMRFTAVNFVVLCSVWFMFMDQARLAFFPYSADASLAVVNLLVWCVLVIELLFQVFIRPEGYQNLIVSEKAFSPSTVRYINSFHLLIESFSLGIYIPEFLCLFNGESCGKCLPFSFHNAAIIGVIGPTRLDIFYGHMYVAFIRLRVFAMVRHWRNFWLAKTFADGRQTRSTSGLFSSFTAGTSGHGLDRSSSVADTKAKTGGVDEKEQKKRDRDSNLTNASHIGTALMATNSYRALASAWAIIGLFPVVFCLARTLTNDVAYQMTGQLQATNLVASDISFDTCEFLLQSAAAWMAGVVSATNSDGPYLLTVDMTPYRCAFDGTNFTNVEICEIFDGVLDNQAVASGHCALWSEFADSTESSIQIAEAAKIREGSIVEISRSDESLLTVTQFDGNSVDQMTFFSVTTRFDQTSSIETFAVSSLLLQLCLLLTVLGGLSTLRRDAEVFVLGPLRRMLKIVARYARNPLVPPKVPRRISRSRSKRSGRFSQSEESGDTSSDESSSGEEGSSAHRELGSFETEQLITAVAKITDLLRKCWGVAGADIISTNLATTREGALTEVFNPTVPGQSVYALFAFAAIGGFDNAVRNLGGDVMPLINDVAAVLHGEVFRWGFGDSGQCNKNLGGAFLMVFRIGLVKEVIEKLEQATGVVFGTVSQKTSKLNSATRRRKHHQSGSLSMHSSAGSRTGSSGSIGDRSSNIKSPIIRGRRKSERHSVNPMSLSLHSLPGISTFTDRAVIGMLKSYAGIYRDRKILNWNDDFRLGAGVGAFNISMFFGMDAGWAVEGAVGSEYKIDATYLSPHVNMASRMTSACKQYDVTIMLSQAVQELMSDVAQSKLRHLDTVTVKGSSVKQKIYTYDAKARGVDFFLYSRSEEQADLDADRYSPGIWQNDQDLKAMRQHITEDFLKIFNDGFKAYTNGDWPTAIKKLEKANDIMFQTAVDEGYLEEEFDALNLRVGTDIRNAAEELKRENGDGPSMCLINFMKSQGGVAPSDWEGWHPLLRK